MGMSRWRDDGRSHEAESVVDRSAPSQDHAERLLSLFVTWIRAGMMYSCIPETGAMELSDLQRALFVIGLPLEQRGNETLLITTTRWPRASSRRRCLDVAGCYACSHGCPTGQKGQNGAG